jgi:hypothetical protein
MAKQPSRRSGGAVSLQAFQQMRGDADELLRTVRKAAEIFRTRPPESFGRLSELIDEVLPVDPAAEARIARAVEMSQEALARIRAQQLDPAGAPEITLALASLGQTLGLSGPIFLGLAGADHALFSGASSAFRDANRSEGDPIDLLRAAWERVELDDPSRLVE